MARSERELTLAQTKAAKLELDMALLHAQRTALNAEVTSRNAQAEMIRSRLDEAIVALQAAELSGPELDARRAQLKEAADRLRAASQPVFVSGSILATPDTIKRGESTQLRWNSFDATSIVITPNIGPVAPSGRITVSPTTTTTYTLKISNRSGSQTEGTATVFVVPVGDTRR